jgi:peroxiredoxin Q/BCP
MEAIEFSDLEDDFVAADAVVLGVSRDDCLAHGAFRDKHGLSVTLLSDAEAEVCEAFGVMVDREVEGVGTRRSLVRSTFIIDKKGVLRDAFYGVNPRGHAREVLDRVKEL